jgi:hypothetical protein
MGGTSASGRGPNRLLVAGVGFGVDVDAGVEVDVGIAMGVVVGVEIGAAIGVGVGVGVAVGVDVVLGMGCGLVNVIRLCVCVDGTPFSCGRGPKRDPVLVTGDERGGEGLLARAETWAGVSVGTGVGVEFVGTVGVGVDSVAGVGAGVIIGEPGTSTGLDMGVVEIVERLLIWFAISRTGLGGARGDDWRFGAEE